MTCDVNKCKLFSELKMFKVPNRLEFILNCEVVLELQKIPAKMEYRGWGDLNECGGETK